MIISKTDDNTVSIPLDPPPEYTFETVPTANAQQPVPNSPRTAVPVNYVSISRVSNSVDASYVIDPTLRLPASLLRPLRDGETEETRPHLDIETTTGDIKLDVTIVDKLRLQGMQQANLLVKSLQEGNVKVQVHAPSPDSRIRFSLSIFSNSGSIAVRVPRSFRGAVVTVVPNGCLKATEDISSQLIALSEDDGTHRSFLGDISNLPEEVGTLDQLYLEASSGNVSILYDDDDAAGPAPTTSLVKQAVWKVGKTIWMHRRHMVDPVLQYKALARTLPEIQMSTLGRKPYLSKTLGRS